MRMRAAIGIMVLAAAIAACGEPDVGCDVSLWPSHPIPDLEMQVGDTVETDLRGHYGSKECVEGWSDRNDVWVVQSADPSAVAVSVSVSEAVLVIAALAVADSVRVTVELTDANVFWADDPPHEFLVRSADR